MTEQEKYAPLIRAAQNILYRLDRGMEIKQLRRDALREAIAIATRVKPQTFESEQTDADLKTSAGTRRER